MKRVVVLQEYLPQYRAPFFDRLRTRLLTKDVELVLVHGDPPPEMARRGDQAELPWATKISNRRGSIGDIRFVWQPALRHVRGADLVIVEQANRHLINYLLLARRKAGVGAALAFWGHGANLQAGEGSSRRERMKAALVKSPDWWFAYTEGVAGRLSGAGYPGDRITIVQNAVEVPDYGSLMVPKRRGECVYIGGLSEEKGIGFLLAAAEAAARRSKDFHLTVVGDGPERPKVQDLAQRESWISYEGPLFGDKKGPFMARAELTLMPGLVGLAIVDTFAAQAPVVTRDLSYHSPEIEYLKPNYNGIRLSATCTPEQYATSVVGLLSAPDQLAALQSGCWHSNGRFTMETMVTNFFDGVVRALALTGSRDIERSNA